MLKQLNPESDALAARFVSQESISAALDEYNQSFDAGRGLRQRLLDEALDGRLVDDVAVLVDDAVLAIAGVRVQRHVAQHAQVGEALLQFAHHARDQAVGYIHTPVSYTPLISWHRFRPT